MGIYVIILKFPINFIPQIKRFAAQDLQSFMVFFLFEH